MEAIQGQRQLFQDTVTFDDDTADLDSPLAETQVEKLGSYTQVLGDSLENAKHELPSQVIPDSEDEEIHGDQLENAADGVSDVETGIRIKGNGVVGLQMRQPSPRFQWLKDVAEAFVSDGSAGEDKGAGALINAEDSDEKTDCPRLVTCDQEFARLNYVDSEEPGESSQASALGFVDHFLSCSDVNFSPRTELRSTTRKKFPPVLSAKGCQHLAKSIKTKTPICKNKTFGGVDNDQHGGVDFFSKRMNDAFDSGGFRQRYVPGLQKAGYSDGKGGCRSDNDSEENYEDLHEKVTGSPQTDSRVAGHSVKETRRTGQGYEFISENANASDNKPGEQFCDLVLGHELGICSNERNTPDILDVGFNTQIAAEAMEALFYGPTADSGAGEAFQDPKDPLVDSSKGVRNIKVHLKELSYEKDALCNLEDITRVPKQSKVYARKGASVSSWKQPSHQELHRDLPEITKRKRSKPLVGELTGRSFIYGNESSATTSRKTVDQRKDEEPERRNNEECDNCGNLSASVESILPGKQQILQDPFASQDSLPRLGAKPKRTNGGSANPGVRTGDFMEGSIITYRRKRSHSVAKPSKILTTTGRCPKFCFNTSEGGRINELSQENLASVKVSTSNSSLKLNVWSYPKGKRTRRGLPSHLNIACSQYTPFTIADGKDHHKKTHNINLPRSSPMKKLIRFGNPKSSPGFRWKDLRKQRDTAHVRVLFSQHLGDDIIRQQKKILARLGISVASSSADATHFVVDRFVRTRNMLEAISLGKPVVTHSWLESCGQASLLIDEKFFILRDAKKEKEIGFSLPVSLARANQQPLLKGQRVFITPNIKPEKEMITSLVNALHGQIMEKSQIFALKVPDDLLILSCEEDHAICVPLLDKGAAAYSSELLLNGIVIQKLEYERHRLFVNGGKRNRVRKR
ncbi:PAX TRANSCRIPTION ACTIVATION DOMAIN INTERACTING PROTEIN [Salix koriyanagi]|uniref:PAX TRANSCRIPTION ACTIVATION DOMAIN INTERACTING PROTEIN n=2 Tax=Salix koriyanagi TaxID=2511006 RepID=A0A9Q0Z6W0_9ROSI|nr:PAX TRANSCRIPTION ACTIVATION DOMAIN INTERACTING PROTEIN [Salix koriyanagi]